MFGDKNDTKFYLKLSIFYFVLATSINKMTEARKDRLIEYFSLWRNRFHIEMYKSKITIIPIVVQV